MFLMWIPRRELLIPRDRITAVQRVTSHLGKTVGHPLLRLHYVEETGRPDSVAWLVRDLPAWEATLG
jgi:hypothetical protein